MGAFVYLSSRPGQPLSIGLPSSLRLAVVHKNFVSSTMIPRVE